MGLFNFKREIKWDKDVMKVTDSMSNIWDSVVHEMSDKIKDEQTEEVLRHFDMDMSELREYLRDKEEWRRKQEAAIPKWIPVTERLPEEKISPMTMDYTEYPCVFDGRDGQREVRYYKFGKGHFWHGPGCIDEYVTHWAEPMPLPEPPKGEDHD